MRVIAGIARSLPLRTPEGADTRPTIDRIKETLFNVLQTDVPGSIFVDLFSGSGSIGIEALSRGARKVYFVENAPKAITCIQQNLAFTKLQNHAVVLKQDAYSALSSIIGSDAKEKADIIFMDPPYNCGHEKAVLAILKDMHYVTEDTLIVVEASLDTDFSWITELDFYTVKEKRYKTNKHVFIKRNPL